MAIGTVAERGTGRAVIAIKGLRKAYGGLEAVKNLDLEIRQGEVFGILGPNGAGKTTTLEMVEGLRKPDGGTIEVAGVDAVRQPARQPLPLDRLRALPGGLEVQLDDEGFQIRTGEPQATLVGLLQIASAADIPVQDLNVRTGNLEDVFINLTGRSLRA